MDDSRVIAAGGGGKWKKSRKNPQPTPTIVPAQEAAPSQPLPEPQPIQQVHQDQLEAMLLDDRFGSDQLHQFSQHFDSVRGESSNAGETHTDHITGQVERISLSDPVHEVLERAGSTSSQIWSTSSWFNNFSLPQLPVEQSEECLALTALKMGLYTLQMREARLAKERGLIVAQSSAEQHAAAAIASLEAERKTFAEEKQRLDAEVGTLRVQLAASQAKILAAEAARVRFEELPSSIPDGPYEVNVDLSAVRDMFKSSDEFSIIKDEHARAQIPFAFGAYLKDFPKGAGRLSAGVALLDKDPEAKRWNDSIVSDLYGKIGQVLLRPFVIQLQNQLGRPVQASDLPTDDIIQAQFEKYLRAQQREADRAAGKEPEPPSDDDEDEDEEGDDMAPSQ
ncbi:unnamed protein product [Cuscuta europaea]|uniref:Uncharacterized protein n=2 Tax=Cuscuta europaea TaxID=41803 RepID=A0A9P1ENC6_CUSEU|nr:unnamed protein product [Cuscuta europaea]